jgi:hypothetical protein
MDATKPATKTDDELALELIDQWAARQGEPLSRIEAVRRLVEAASAASRSIRAAADSAATPRSVPLPGSATKAAADRAAAPKSVAGPDLAIKNAADRAEERSKRTMIRER